MHRRNRVLSLLGLLALVGTAMAAPAVTSAGSPTEVSIPFSSWTLWWETEPVNEDTTLSVAVDAINTTPYRINPYATVRVRFHLEGGGTSEQTYADNGAVASVAPGQHASVLVVGEFGSLIDDVDIIEVTVGGVVQVAPLGAVGISSSPIDYDDGANEAAVTVTIRNTRPTSLDVWKVSAAFFDADGILSIGTVEPNTSIAPGASAQFPITAVVFAEPTVVRVGMSSSPAGEVVTWTNWFHDVGSSAFQQDIAWIAEAGITTGCGAQLYCPSSSVTRGQMASFLVRALDLAPTTTDYFDDDESSVHEADINALRAAGVTTGCAATLFCPTGLVTRAQMASFLVRALDLPSTPTDYFTDDETSVHEADINALRAAGVTTGCGPGAYCPTASVPREQMAAFLRRALE